MRKRSFSIGALSDIGYVKKTNQDRILIEIGEEKFGEFGLFVVADGMGGLSAGDKAGDIVIAEFRSWWDKELSLILNERKKLNLNIIDKKLNDLIFKINNKVMEFSRSINKRVGTTLSMLFIYRDQYIIKHIGDSRIYKINEDMIKLTKDHSWVAQQIRQGKMNIQEAVNHPRKNVLLQCIGIKETLDIFSKKGQVLEKDIFLLCSDGFYNLLKKDEILKAVIKYEKKYENPQKIIDKLIEKVKERGAVDNASAILIYHRKDEEKTNLFKRLREIIDL
ncbi:PP2C family protein-serine/threonine phosphatase [Paramaledivibacter caminithermalis]|uniref:Serine/threonine protein phosphatase PrpC n=1 Tax=Paramaledivibacter caminithermalis (strain DSM 15212 / CIP 107654 / DViRD3) TaxID=1121301 RepID=A0A1M6PI55_PARC5|nr:PP2C family serine/threonine-protein phosphatase [Paramaledivibacter caminithermalis]SHK07625.1 Serine/threonine protein phosphatase PrpC [Paramaledivibacter caminithermalis DSM 15212]